MKIKWKATISLILAIITVITYSYLGIEKEVRVDLTPCGYSIVKDKFIEIHSKCKIMVKSGIIPKIEMEEELIKMTIPEGWKWRIVP